VKLLVLGGTLFVGRHVVDAALERGHDVTLFNRGQTNPSLFPDVEHLRGDREADLAPLVGRKWDAVVDPSGYLPRVVRATVELLVDATAHYTFISSVSAYRDFAEIGIDEEYPLAVLPEESEDVDRYYGPLKARCEDLVRSTLGARALVVRPGVVVGPYDWTNRFGWWVRRLAAGGEVLVPAADEWPVQIVHGRDLADWILTLAEEGMAGTFNAVTRARPMSQVLEEIHAAVGSAAEFTFVDEQFLLGRGVEPWDDLPLWLAAGPNPEFRGMMAVDVSRAEAAGLRHRPLEDTARETLAWEEQRVSKDYGPRSALATGLASDRERELLAAWATLKP
jgi:2'-hydroxyisoflavone reductase